MSERFPCYVVRQAEDAAPRAAVEQLSIDELPAGDVLVRVEYSSLNYKDALAARGHRGVVKTLPHVPGIDAAGRVAATSSARFAEGDSVIVTGYELGAGRWGGHAGYVRVPESWVVPLPSGLTLRESMVYGTAGFTAAQAVQAILDRRIDRGQGEVAVTGATGGVGSLAVALLAKVGYRVVAVTGKPAQTELLKSLGAARVLGRDALAADSSQPLLAARWAAAVDTVGGSILSCLLRSTAHRGCVAACGMVAGTDVPMTVYPFILRGIALLGIDSAKCPMPERLALWSKLAGPWKPTGLEPLVQTIGLKQLDEQIEQILQGKMTGRVLVQPFA